MEKINAVIKALENNNMNAYFVENKIEAKALTEKLLEGCDTVSHGGSVTLTECGITELLSNGNYTYLDRSKAKNPEEMKKIYVETFDADAYISGTNAITEDGKLYNVDGNCNRIAAIEFGPKKVIILAGVNKIVKDLDEAALRVKKIAAPLNAKRLNLDTYCNKFGECVSVKSGGKMTDGCNSPSRICCSYSICAQQRIKGRISVIIINENLGY